MDFDQVSIALSTASEPKVEGALRAFGLYWESIKHTKHKTTGRHKQPVGWQQICECLDDRLQALDEEPTDFYVALESGIIPNVFASGEAVDLSVAAIHDKRAGKSAGNTFYGVSPGFVVPKDIIEQMPPRGKSELANAFRDQYGFDAKGRSGVIGPLSLQRIRRTDFEFLAVLMALWQIVYPMGPAGPTSGRPTSESS